MKYIQDIYIYNIYIYIYKIYIYNMYIEVAIDKRREWDLNPQPLNSIQKLQPTELSGHEFNSCSTMYMNAKNDLKQLA